MTINQAEVAPDVVLENWLDSTKGEGDLDRALRKLIRLYRHNQQEIQKVVAEAISAEKQRDFLGAQLRNRIERYHALRVSHGDMQAEALMPSIGSEVNAIRAACDQMAEQSA